MPEVNTALLSCLPMMLEKKKVYSAPKMGLTTVRTTLRTRFSRPISSVTARMTSRMVGA